MRILISAFCLCCAVICNPATEVDDDLIAPKNPLVEKAAPNPKVTNGHVFESGSMDVPKDQKLIVPKNAVVEEYDGSRVLFFVTKSMHCAGHPPAPMALIDARNYFGIAVGRKDDEYRVATFGEWSNKGGSAAIRLSILVPRGLAYQKSEGLDGPKSAACRKIDFKEPALETCYWYAGIGPQKGWKRISTDLHYNRFLKPN